MKIRSLKLKNEKVKNTLWILFIVIAMLVTGFNLYRLWSIYNVNASQYVEEIHDDHDHHDDLEALYANFTGIKEKMNEVGIQNTFFGANNTNYFYAGSAIYKDTENGTVYWYSDADNSVYQLSGENCQKLFEKQATGLVQYNNKLYFISYEDAEQTYEAVQVGYIWVYDFNSKSLTNFSDILVASFNILDGKIHCIVLKEDKIMPYNIAENGSYQEDDYIYCGSYKDYLLAYDYQYTEGFMPLYLIQKDTPERIQIVSNNVLILEQCIYKDTLYYIYYASNDEAESGSGKICAVNLLTGEQKAFDIEKIIGHSHKQSYNFANDKLYLMGENVISEIDLITGKAIKKSIETTKSDLYSDGETIYFVKEDSDGKNQLVSFNDFASFYKLVK